ncbi:hypothetical protein LSTR_LSTR000933 [Laodelphax striatellus]|uniref:Uncharacterized protein n=1 Tax=Laodelphax striatellus TaxID=195883 RepID=A0A482X189_LAOST|nr:hypothetical protein LSTR_LSTR000933 [Laodelphax striatellus]
MLSENVPWKECVFLTSFMISLVGATMKNSQDQTSQTSLPDLVYNPFTDYMLNLATYNGVSEEIKQHVLENSLIIQDLVPLDLLKKDKQFDWEVTTTIGIETQILHHFNNYPSHKPIFDHALELWRKRNRDIMKNEHVESVGNPTIESDSVEHEILQATLIETKGKLRPEEFTNLISTINLKISLENLFTVLPVYKRSMFLKMASYFENQNVNKEN